MDESPLGRAVHALARYVAMKGSVAVDGVSLTVSGLGARWFEVSLIPTTLALTTLGRKQLGEQRANWERLSVAVSGILSTTE